MSEQGIGAAIAGVMSKVKRIQKSETNRHGNYKYAGVEAFLDHLRPLMAEYGVSVVQAMTGAEVVGADPKRAMLVGQFEFTILHEGEERGPFHGVGMANASMGAQAVGAAQSYALKFFLRSLFMVSADEDAAHDVDAQKAQPLQDRSAEKEAKGLALDLCSGDKAAAIECVRNACAALNLGAMNELDAAGWTAVYDHLSEGI